MTTRTSAVLKANWDERDPAEQFDDLVDTIHNPQDAVDFDGAVTLSSTVAIQGDLTISNTKDILPATGGGSDLGSTTAEWGSIYVSDSKGIYFGADQDASIVQDGSVGLDISVADNDADALRVVQGSNEYMVFDTRNSVERVDVMKPLNLQKGADKGTFFDVFDDFLMQTITEADTPWVLNSGTNAGAIDPAVSAQENGVLRLTTGTHNGTVANNGSQLVCHIPMQADSGNLFFETRLHINTAISSAKVNAGFTDSTSLELPYACVGTAYAATASDAAVFMLDYQAGAAGSWHTVTVDTNVEDHGNDAVAYGPTSGTYQKLRIEIDTTGGTCYWFINDALINTTSHAGVTPTANLYATVIASGGSWAQKTVDVDYIHAGHTRSQP